MKKIKALYLGCIMGALPAAGHELDAEAKNKLNHFINGYIKENIVNNHEVVNAVKKANKLRAKWSQYKGIWRTWNDSDASANQFTYDHSEYLWSQKKDQKFKDLFVNSSLSHKLKGVQSKSNGKILELFITDNKGGNVVQSEATSDWYQGDESKFRKAANKKEPFYGKIKRDSTVKQSGLHASVPMWDGDEFIGVAIIFVNLDSL